jgi:type IV secretory pathway ATPase VirB11/archaellum biosynthesis ATPase
VAEFRKLIQRPHGILLVTGPTGSGKTTSLYSALAEINAPDVNILTIEDPIEYELRGIGQTQVNHKIDLTFASALRAHLLERAPLRSAKIETFLDDPARCKRGNFCFFTFHSGHCALLGLAFRGRSGR